VSKETCKSDPAMLKTNTACSRSYINYTTNYLELKKSIKENYSTEELYRIIESAVQYNLSSGKFDFVLKLNLSPQDFAETQLTEVQSFLNKKQNSKLVNGVCDYVSSFAEEEILEEFSRYLANRTGIQLKTKETFTKPIATILQRGTVLSRQEYDLLKAHFDLQLSKSPKLSEKLRQVESILSDFEENKTK